MLLLVAGGKARLAARDGGAREEVRCGQRAEETKPVLLLGVSGKRNTCVRGGAGWMDLWI